MKEKKEKDKKNRKKDKENGSGSGEAGNDIDIDAPDAVVSERVLSGVTLFHMPFVTSIFVTSILKSVIIYRTVRMMTMTGQRKPQRRPSVDAWKRSANAPRT